MPLNDTLWWWFSFFDMERQPGERLLGAAVVHGADYYTAVAMIARFGCNPGGEGRSVRIPAELGVPPEAYQERLLDPGEARMLADLLEARRSGSQDGDCVSSIH